MSDTLPTKPQPFDKIYSMTGKFVIPIWRNEDDDEMASFSITAHESRYKDKKTDKYKSTTTVFDRDAAELAATYADARDRMKLHRDAAYRKWKARQQGSDAQPPANETEPIAEEQAA